MLGIKGVVMSKMPIILRQDTGTMTPVYYKLNNRNRIVPNTVFSKYMMRAKKTAEMYSIMCGLLGCKMLDRELARQVFLIQGLEEYIEQKENIRGMGLLLRPEVTAYAYLRGWGEHER